MQRHTVLGADCRIDRAHIGFEYLAGNDHIKNFFQSARGTGAYCIELILNQRIIAGYTHPILGRDQCRIGQARAKRIPVTVSDQLLEDIRAIGVREIRSAET